MAHPLERKIAQVRRHARLLVVLYALGWTLALVAGAIMLLGLVDYWVRVQDHGIRLIASLTVVAVSLAVFYRCWYLGLGRRLSDVEIARRIEERFPVLTDRLASTVQFLQQSEDDPLAGSPALRRAVILQTTTDIEGYDFAQVFERRPTWRALTAAASAALVAMAFAVTSPQCTQIALARLARPFGNDSWPKLYRVEFREAPTRLAAGQPFEVELIKDAAHRVPEEVRLHYRYETGTGSVEEETETMKRLAGATVGRKDSVSRPFWYRAEGGDDASMEWIRLEVLEPPRIDSLEVTLHPPAYTGLPVETCDKSIQAIRGTRVELVGASTKKLTSATVRQENGEPHAVEVTADGYGFLLRWDTADPLVVEKSGPYWIELQDVEGLTGGQDDRWDIRAVADQAPTVTVEQPAANIFVTPQAEVPLRVVAKDDLAIHQMAIHFNRSDRTDVEDFSLPLYDGPERVAPAVETGLLAAGRVGESRAIDHSWKLADLNLKPGVQLNFWATASDYLPQIGKSTVRRISIITPQELEERLAQRQTLIFGELERVLKLQQDARAQTRSLEIQLGATGRLNKQDVDHAQSAELNQRQVKRTLTSPTEGIPAQIADFLTDLASNRVDNPDIERRMTSIVEELERLGDAHLGTIERELTSVIKAAQSKLPADAKEKQPAKAPADPLVNKSLSAVAQNQDQVIGSLERMLGDLGQWDNYRRFSRDIAELQRAQQEIEQATKDMAGKTLGRETKDLDAQQQADLKKLAGQQMELSRKLEKTQQQMAQMSQSLQQTNPLSAATISDGLHHARKQAISGQMRHASEQLEKNQLGQAAQQQAQAGKDLEELSGILSNRREQELTRLVKQLRESERELEKLRAEQAGLNKKMRAAAEKPESPERKRELERLAREQKRLEDESQRLARRLERLQAEQAGRSASGAAGKMSQAGDAGQKGDAAGAEEQAEQAEKDLEQAIQQLAERRQQAEEDLAREQMARLEDSLKSLLEREAKLEQDTARLEKLRAAEGRLTRAQLGTVNDLARQQKSLEGETTLLAEKLAVTEVISMALDGAAQQMARAAKLLGERETGRETQDAQEAARRRFAQLLTAFANKPKPGNGQEGEAGAGAGGGGGSKGDNQQGLAQLKLLKILQEDLNTRYRKLSTKPGDQGPELANLAEEMAAEQGKLAELTLKLSQPTEKNPEDDPEHLPDVRKEGPMLEEGPGDDVPPPEQTLDGPPAGKERSQ